MTEKTKEKRERILKAGLLAARKTGYSHVKREDIAAENGSLPAASIQYYFRSIERLRQEIVRQAIKDEDLIVLAQALGNGDTLALAAPLPIKMKAIEFIQARAINTEK